VRGIRTPKGTFDAHFVGGPVPESWLSGDALVGVLLVDLSVPLAPDAVDSGDPVEVPVVELADLLYPSMNWGNSSNCVHWLYAVRRGTWTSTDSSTVLMDLSVRRSSVDCQDASVPRGALAES
jgi:hypothetical protein